MDSDELKLLLGVPTRLLAIGAYSILYAIGGTGGFNKLFRRLGSPIAFALILVFVAPKDFRLLSLLALIPPLWLGYGGGETERRVIYALTSGLCGAFVCWVYGSNGMAIFQFLLTILGTTYLGVLNPIHARHEEALIAMTSVSAVAFCVF